MRTLALPLLAVLAVTGSARAETLDLERRVAAHRAVEQALWERRIWPEANPERKPPLSAVLPDNALRAKVEEGLRKSAALADLWKRPVGAAELQAELDRMLRDSKAPETLDAMLTAVDRDPLLAAEVIARPALADQLLRAWYAGNDFDAWWAGERLLHEPSVPDVEASSLSLSRTLSGASCPEDTWSRMDAGAPAPRWYHRAVWTGTEMIVWGGHDGTNTFGTGGRYTPATDSWAAMSEGPQARMGHAAVWTGTRVVVWGGFSTSVGGPLNTGGRYDPAADAWSDVTTVGAPTARGINTFVWTGSRLVIWGGDFGNTSTGGRYDPVSDSWSPTSMAGAPPEADIVTSVWTGQFMVVWPGKRYDPVSDVWASITAVGAPSGRSQHTAVWTGSRMIVWGGHAGATVLDTGGIYDPVNDAWTSTSLTGAPSARGNHAAAWVGGRMVIWGGEAGSSFPLQTGGNYDPVTNSWAATTTTGAPPARWNASAIATPTEMIVWGGLTVGGALSTGGRYNPATNSWVPTRAGAPAPSPRWHPSTVWTGTEAIVWGGEDGNGSLATGGRYVPATDSWASVARTASAPTPRFGHSAVWTGTEMLVWGGQGQGDGARYGPAGDTWTAMASAGAPSGREEQSAVWTGTQMIVWGGFAGGELATGGRYDPAANTWTPTSLVGAPLARNRHSAVWGGGRMIVWGGMNLSSGFFPGLATGGIYDPGTDTWSATATAGAPAGRRDHAAVWTGSRMLVWGGTAIVFKGDTPFGDGASYDPVTGAWSPLASVNAPYARWEMSAVWTGTEMIVWGGRTVGFETFDDGGRYLPDTDTWRPTSTAGAPRSRHGHGAVWAGDLMLVWGGFGFESFALFGDGAGYCACVTWYPDQDGDGWGDTFAPTTTCDGTRPPGSASRPGDCNDSNPSAHPGVPSDPTCDEVDDDCDGLLDEDYLSQPSVCGVGVCHSFGSLDCIGGQVVNSCVPGTPTSSVDFVCNNLDDDCDGGVDDDFPTYHTDHWVAIASAPVARSNYTAVSSGAEILVFGGDDGSGFVLSGGNAYDLAANTWRTLPAGPTKRWHHTAVWADNRMIVWGGDDGSTTIYNTGSRYTPATNTWAATIGTGAPTARGGHVAVWTGSRMVIWGGRDVSNYFNTGSRYDPVANNWSATTTTGAPAGRWQATAVWTGTEMIVWGGTAAAGTGLATGGRYSPSTNTWTATATAGAPVGRWGHIAVWTGTEMVVWGGTSNGSNYLATGGRYNPSTNTWTAMSTVDVPAARAFASAIWTGPEVVVWGGTNGSALGDGGRYLLGNNVWVPTNPYFAPDARAHTMAVLQGGEMFVWGGDSNGSALEDGARYVPTTVCGASQCQRLGAMVCSGGGVSFQCTPGTPQTEVCNGSDDDCDTVVDDGIPVPSGVPSMTGVRLVDNTALFSWPATPDTTAYDMVKGSLSTLRSTAGDFTNSQCMQNDNPMTQGWDVAVPPAGEGIWYLVRPVNSCSGNGSFNGPMPPQQGSRDAELAASGLPCP